MLWNSNQRRHHLEPLFTLVPYLPIWLDNLWYFNFLFVSLLWETILTCWKSLWRLQWWSIHLVTSVPPITKEITLFFLCSTQIELLNLWKQQKGVIELKNVKSAQFHLIYLINCVFKEFEWNSKAKCPLKLTFLLLKFIFWVKKEKKDFCAKDNKVEIRCEFPSFRGCEWIKICF